MDYASFIYLNKAKHIVLPSSLAIHAIDSRHYTDHTIALLCFSHDVFEGVSIGQEGRDIAWPCSLAIQPCQSGARLIIRLPYRSHLATDGADYTFLLVY